MLPPEMHTLHVELGERRYPIRIGAGLLADADAFTEIAFGRHVLLVSDSNVAPLYAERVLAMLPKSCEAVLHTIPAGERTRRCPRARPCSRRARTCRPIATHW